MLFRSHPKEYVSTVQILEDRGEFPAVKSVQLTPKPLLLTLYSHHGVVKHPHMWTLWWSSTVVERTKPQWGRLGLKVCSTRTRPASQACGHPPLQWGGGYNPLTNTHTHTVTTHTHTHTHWAQPLHEQGLRQTNNKADEDKPSNSNAFTFTRLIIWPSGRERGSLAFHQIGRASCRERV